MKQKWVWVDAEEHWRRNMERWKERMIMQIENIKRKIGDLEVTYLIGRENYAHCLTKALLMSHVSLYKKGWIRNETITAE